MRFVIPNDNESSRVLRGYLLNAGLSVGEKPLLLVPFFRIEIEETRTGGVLIDSVDSPFERAIFAEVRLVAEVTTTTQGGRTFTDNAIRIEIPEDKRGQVVLAIYTAILRRLTLLVTEKEQAAVIAEFPSDPPTKRGWRRLLGWLSIFILCTSAAMAQGTQTGPTSVVKVNCVSGCSGSATNQAATGTITAAEGAVTLTAANVGTTAVQITGTWSATLQFEGTVDDTNYFSLNAYPPTSTTAANNTAANGQWFVPTAGLKKFRVRASAYTSGTATITAEGSNGTSFVLSASAGGGGGGGTQYTEDAVAPADPIGTALNLVRKDTLAPLTSADGDNVTARGTDKGELYIKHVDAIAASQSGTWTVQPGNTANTTAWKVDGSAVTQPVSGTFWQATQPVSGTFWQATQPVSGTFWQATQPVSGTVTSNQGTPNSSANRWPFQVTDGTDLALVSGTGSLQVTCDNCGAPSSFADNSAFTFGTTGITNIGAVVDDTATNTVAENSAGNPRMTVQRGLHMNLRTNGGVEVPFPAALGANGGLKIEGVASGVAVPVSGTFWQATQPVSGTVTSNAGTGTFTVAGAKTNNNAAPGATNLGTLPAVAQAAAPTYTEGNQVTLSTDLAGALRVSGSSGGGVAQTQVRNSGDTAWVNVGPAAANARMPSTIYSSGGTELATSANPLRTDPTGTTTQPVSGTFWQATQPVSGTVTANIGTAGSLALDASVTGLQVTQGSTTAGQKGELVQGAVTTAAPTYTTAQTSPLSLNTAGGLRVDGSGATQPVSGTVTANAGTGTFNIQANASVNVAQINAVTPLMGNGVTGTGSQRVTIASDNTAFSVNATVSQATAANLKAQTEGTTAHDAVGTAVNPVAVGGYGSNAIPTDASADTDITRLWLLRSGATMTANAPHLGMTANPYTLTMKSAQYTTAQTGTALWTPTAGKRLVITSYQIQVGGTTAGTSQLWFEAADADTTFTRGTDLTIFDGDWAPSATSKPGALQTGVWVAGAINFDLRVTTSTTITITITVWGYEI